MHFSFYTPTHILFGCGRSRELTALLPTMGTRVLLVTGKASRLPADVRAALSQNSLAVLHEVQAGEPTVDDAAGITARCREWGADLVVAVGGGSVVDCAKAVAALAVNPEPITAYLEVVGEGRPLTRKPLPLVALPTTSGTGAEVTVNSVLSCPEHGIKVSLRHPLMAPDTAIVDPDLSLSLPPFQTAATGMDALTQLVESFLSRFSNPMTDGLCREGIQQVGKGLETAFKKGNDREARTCMSLAALQSGVALANAKLGSVHGIAGPMGGMIPAPHGVICARLLGPCLATNLRLAPQHPAGYRVKERLARVGSWLTGQTHARPEALLEWVEKMVQLTGMPPLSRYGLDNGHRQRLCDQAIQSSSMKGNPLDLTPDHIHEILAAV